MLERMPADPAANEPPPESVDSLTELLRSGDDRQLLALLRSRPDLATPPPTDSAVLAARATVRSSVTRACEDLDSFSLNVLEALVLLDADERTVSLERLTGFFGGEATREQLRSRIDPLRERALVWGPDEALRTAVTVRETIGAHPAGLGAELGGLSEQRAREVLAELDDEELGVVTKLAGASPIGRTGQAKPGAERSDTPIGRLLLRGLLLRRDENTVELPRELGLAARGDRPMGNVATAEPVPELDEHGQQRIDGTAAGEALELNRHVELLLESWGQEPPDVLRSGGVGVRDIRELARKLGSDETRAALVVELAAGTGLVDTSPEEDPQWVPTVQADVWLAASPEHRWALLAGSWLELPRLPGLIGSRDARDRLLGTLSEGLRRSSAPRDRRRVLELLDEQPGGWGFRRDDGVAAVLAWRAPRRGGSMRDELVTWTLREARALGIVALGGLSSAGRALLTGDESAAAGVMASAIPEPVDHVLVQADLTVVAPGRLEPELAAELNLAADVESAGSATVYRVNESSVRRALDAGRSSEQLRELFEQRSRTPVPQGLTYLIDDTARRHGKLRAGTASSFLRCEDPVVLTEVLGKQRLAHLGLRRIAPTVLISPLPLEQLVDELRGNGYAPVAESTDGGVLDLSRGPQRIKGRGRYGGARGEPSNSARPDEQQLTERVRTLRAGDQAAATRGNTIAPERGRPSANATLELLREAARQSHSVWLGFVDAQGGATQRIVRPVSVGGGVLQGFDSARGELGDFPLHRITSVAVVDQ
ncbi:Helicase conserved C-terminal domain-containing protein [Actinopolyspora lacussalsi subsp. righensis]|uniref:Helicase conserved C-terminal domain-containing protein n=2 Tax=Actinopolyspora righensis TaxID=995060 RepID=A0A1I6Y3P3_9ACTN|nr:Helicase conserved C-terminal domain-containing protein [Actinopolyspora righensis]